MSFLRGKLVGVTAAEIVQSEAEAWLLWLTRGLPGAVGFVLRYACFRLTFKRLAGFCYVQHGVTIVHPRRLSVGRHFGCNTGTYINAIGEITIGDYVLIGTNVTISSGRHPVEGAEPPVFARPVVPHPIVIEDDVWIGANAVIMPGVRIARGSVIGANAVVTRDTAAYSVNVGMPARMIRSRVNRT